MAKDTKEKILESALEMFSKKGYEATNVRDITASLGIVKSGAYKHYSSKEEIWNTLLDKMIAYYDERFGSTERLPPVPDSLDGLAEMTMRIRGDGEMKNHTIAKCLSLSALLLFATATFRITSGHFRTGAVCFGAAACFMAAVGKYRKKEAEENRQKEEWKQS